MNNISLYCKKQNSKGKTYNLQCYTLRFRSKNGQNKGYVLHINTKLITSWRKLKEAEIQICGVRNCKVYISNGNATGVMVVHPLKKGKHSMQRGMN